MRGADGPAQQRQLGHQRLENIAEAGAGLRIGGLDLRRRTEGLDHEIDRPVLQVQAAVAQAGGAGAAHVSTRTLLSRSTDSSDTAREA